MKLPKGFGKNYFTLSAITATVNQITILAQTTRVQSFHLLDFQSDELDEVQGEDELTTICPIQLSIKPCYCNYHFLRYTLKTLKLYNNQKLFFNYFKNLNNSSPPYLFFI